MSFNFSDNHPIVKVIGGWASRNVTFGLILAITTEVPRWTFAFSAAHEPIWAGCALAALMSYAAAHAWEEYFARHDRLLLTLNGLSLGFGVFTISPVIFAMTQGGGHSVQMNSVQMTSILPTPLLWLWSVVLASTTFLPLIQVAVVEVRRRERVQPVLDSVQMPAQRVKPVAQPSVQSVAESVQVPAHPVQKCVDVFDQLATDDVQPDPRTVAAQLRTEGLSIAQIGEQLGVHRNTVGKWLRSAE